MSNSSRKDGNSDHSGKLLSFDLERLSTYGRDVDTIEELTSNPIKCGFLLAFCESEFSAENMHFVVEIDRFRDYYLTTDRSAWNTDLKWRMIDSMIGINESTNVSEEEMRRILADEELVVGDETAWPSKKILFNNSVEHIQKIWNNYLAPSAPHQICMPYRVLLNTRKRLENFHLYGGFVFEETLIDPFKTLKRDSIPRYIASDYYRNMQKRLDLVFPLPDAHNLSLALPSRCLSASWPVEDITIASLAAITLPDMLHDRVLYAHFLVYCKKLFSEENLYCARAISIFKCHYKGHTKCPPAAEDMAWTIFRYFVAPKSVYEVSLSHRRKKEFMQLLANPEINMFQKVEKSVFNVLRGQWMNYVKTPEFLGMADIILEEKRKLETGEDTRASSSEYRRCFPFIK
jgi:hypothetical protein